MKYTTLRNLKLKENFHGIEIPGSNIKETITAKKTQIKSIINYAYLYWLLI